MGMTKEEEQGGDSWWEVPVWRPGIQEPLHEEGHPADGIGCKEYEGLGEDYSLLLVGYWVIEKMQISSVSGEILKFSLCILIFY